MALLVAAALAALVTTASGQCLQPGAVPSFLPLDNSAYGMCPEGYYCPNSTLADNSTWPQICPATPECIKMRIKGKRCPPQGIYEPQVCPDGHYCPNARTAIKCPKGYYCPAGATKKRKCSALSSCPEGTVNEFFVGAIFVVGLVNIFVVLCFVGYSYWKDKHPTVMAAPAKGEEEDNNDPYETSSGAVADGVRRAGGHNHSLTIEFNNLHVTLGEKDPTAPGKVLLQDVTGMFRAGKVTAVIGPSGAGKSVFMNTVLGKADDTWKIDGTVRVNGVEEAIPQLKHAFGVVPQDDVLHGDLTVIENVQYMSDLRLPADWTADERTHFQHAVLRALKIGHVVDIPIGDAERRGVSGGQRKRASIALELAAAPTALFLDDPTTGLDATTAMDVCQLFRHVAQRANMPVAMIVSQPRVEIWNELDELLLLAPGGRTVFQGPRREAVAYFEAVGSMDFSKGNPCDIIVDAIAHRGNEFAEKWKQKLEEAGDEPAFPRSPLSPAAWSKALPDARVQKGFFVQFAYAFVRALKKMHASPFSLLFYLIITWGSTIVTTAVAVDEPLTGLLNGNYVELSGKAKLYVVQMLTFLWFIGLAGALGPSGVRSFADTQLQYWREAASGLNRVAFYLANSSVSALRVGLLMLNFTAVAHLMWRPYLNFFAMWGIMFLGGLSADAIGVIFGIFLPVDSAVLLATIVLIFGALLNGYPNLPAIPNISYTKWVTEALLNLEATKVKHLYAEKQLEKASEDLLLLYRLGLDIGLVVMFAVLFRAIGLVAILLWRRDKMR